MQFLSVKNIWGHNSLLIILSFFSILPDENEYRFPLQRTKFLSAYIFFLLQ